MSAENSWRFKPSDAASVPSKMAIACGRTWEFFALFVVFLGDDLLHLVGRVNLSQVLLHGSNQVTAALQTPSECAETACQPLAEHRHQEADAAALMFG